MADIVSATLRADPPPPAATQGPQTGWASCPRCGKGSRQQYSELSVYFSGHMRAIGLATVAAIAIQPFFFALWFLLPIVLVGEGPSLLHEVFGMLMLVVVFAAGFVLVLGLPIFFVLRLFKWDNWWSLAAAGFMAGAILVGILGWPRKATYNGYSSGGNWHGRHVNFVVDGIPTLYGWLSYAEDILIYGLHGLVGALVFYFVWRRYSPAEKDRRP